VTGPGTATGSGGYNTANSFRFFSGDTVAGVAGVTKSNLFTNSYIVNVGGDQAAGSVYCNDDVHLYSDILG